MPYPLAVPVAVTALLLSAYAMNEWTHGATSEAVGLGHHHMADYGGYHCATQDGSAYGAMGDQPMHANTTMPEPQCVGATDIHGGPMHPGTSQVKMRRAMAVGDVR